MTTQDPCPPEGIVRPRNAAEVIVDTIEGRIDELSEDVDEHADMLGKLDKAIADLKRSLDNHTHEAGDDGLSDEDCRQLSDRLWAESEARAQDATLGTREQWNAIQCLREAAMRLYSVYAWGQRAAHPTHMSHTGNDTDKETQK